MGKLLRCNARPAIHVYKTGDVAEGTKSGTLYFRTRNRWVVIVQGSKSCAGDEHVHLTETYIHPVNACIKVIDDE